MPRESLKRLFPVPIDFDWDEGNAEKNWIRHRVSQGEAEAVFYYDPQLIRCDVGHSHHEQRYVCLGKTKQNRYLFVSFTLRQEKVRIISARDMTDREHQEFTKYEKKNT